MRLSSRTIPALGAAAAAILLAGGAASASAAPSAPQVTLTGNIAGNPRITEPGDTDTFVFTETSTASTGVYWFIQPFHQTGLTLGQVLCVYPTHEAASDADGWTCEPYLGWHGATTSLVLTTHITGAPGSTASVKVCAYNGGAAGFAQVCKTLSVTING